jgi:nicotinamide mononucleotide transporter
MNKIKDIIAREWINGYSKFDRLYMAAMLLLQIVVFILVPDTWISIVAGISGVIATVLCAKGKISFYFIGFIQTFTYLYLSWVNCFYGEVIENIFYLVTMVWGIFVWKSNLTHDDEGADYVETKGFSKTQWALSIVGTIIATLGMGYFLTTIGSHQAYTDAATNVFAIFAQILMVRRYKEQWIWWFAIDVFCIKLWWVAGNWSMVAMYIAWTINCIYGWYNWNKLTQGKKDVEVK